MTAAALLALLAGLAPAAPARAQAATWYVSPGGDDAAACQSAESACRTVGAALAKAAPGDTVRLAAGSYPENLALTKSVTIAGAGAAASALDGQRRGSVLTISSPQLSVTLRDLAVVNGQAVGAGGGIASNGSLTLEGVTVRDNAVTLGEGFQGLGGGIASFGPLAISASAVVGNRGVTGGGIYSQGGLSATNLTLAENVASAGGGGLAAGPGAASLSSSTVAANRAGADGGGLLALAGATLRLADSILAGNSDGGGDRPDCAGVVGSNGFNVFGDTRGCALAAVGGDFLDLDPRLGPLGDNGGPTPTLALLEGSPAIDAAFRGRCPAVDQRGVSRPQGEGCDSGAFELEVELPPPPARTFYADPAGDDASDCLSATSACRTIAAAAAKAADGDTLRLAAGVYGERVSLLKGLTVEGAGADRTVIDATGRGGPAFTVLSPQIRVALRGVTVRGGSAVGAGGGIFNSGSLTLEGVTVRDNAVALGEGFQGLGGGIASFGPLVISATAVISNSGVTGGGIYSQGGLSATNLTLAENVASAGGGGMALGPGAANLRHVTVSANRAGAAGGLLAEAGASVSLGGSILADNRDDGGSAPECAGELRGLGGSVLGDLAGCAYSQGQGDVVGADPLLGPLGDNGGPTPTLALLEGSPAIDAAAAADCPADDQRGVSRPQGAGCDSGAFEAEPPPPDPDAWYVAPGGDDAADCQSVATPCATIGGALAKAGPGDTLHLAAGSYAERLTLGQDVTLSGAGAGASVIDGAGAGTVVRVPEGVRAALRGLTLRGGAGLGGVVNAGTLTIEDSAVQENRASFPAGGDGLGGGIVNLGTLGITRTAVLSNTGVIGAGVSNRGTLWLVESEIRGNSGLIGGGLANFGQATALSATLRANIALLGGGAANFGALRLEDSLVLGNIALLGGGLANFGRLEIVNSALSANVAHGSGGGLANERTGRLSLRHVTIADNAAGGPAEAGPAGGLANAAGGTVELTNTLIAGNHGPAGAPADCAGELVSQGHNLLEHAGGCTLRAAAGDVVGRPAGLGARPAGAEGPPALAPLPGSPAIDSADPAACTPHDQRGAARPQGRGCDIGAYEAAAPASAGARLYLPALRR